MKRTIPGLDSLRFFCALWVVFVHYGAPPLAGAEAGSTLQWLNAILFNGQAAVILFFIISGFCIHSPQAAGARLHLPTFYARRLLRIGIPWLVLELGIHFFTQGDVMRTRIQGITWTLKCEITYYLLYPALLHAAKRWGWMRLLACAYAAAFLVTAHYALPDDICGFLKFQWNVIVGLPAWLLGCVLAEDFSKRRDFAKMPRAIWLWRAVAWAASSLCLLLMYRQVAGMIWTLNFFAILGYFYVRAEILYHQTAKPVRAFELLGMASYSMYLTHLLAISWMGAFGRTDLSWPRWALLMAAVFALAGVYYMLVEFPSHQLARRFRATNPRPA